jgi:tellurite resistance protein TerC
MVTVLAEGAQTAGGHALLNVAPWEWLLAGGVLVAYTTYELIAGRKVIVGATTAQLMKSAGRRWLVSFLLAVAFGMFILIRHGASAAQQYTAGFIVEYGLSFDNVAVWAQILAAFVFFRGYHRKLLMFGALVSIACRMGFIFLGVTLIQRLAFITIALGLFLIYTAKGLVWGGDDEDFKLEENKFYQKVARPRFYTRERYGMSFVTTQANGGVFGRKLTPFGMCAVIFGGVDLMFALDSIPAIFSITKEPYIVATSNMFAVLGLVTLYFVFDALQDKISKLNEGLAIILFLIGAKMLVGSQLFIDLVWNGYVINWSMIGWTAVALYGPWALVNIVRLIRGGRVRWPKKTTIFMAGFVLLKLYAGWTSFNDLKTSLVHLEAKEAPVWMSLVTIVLVLGGAYLWGIVFPEEHHHATTVQHQIGSDGKVIDLEPLVDKVETTIPAAV